jgi:lipoprotein NlpI
MKIPGNSNRLLKRATTMKPFLLILSVLVVIPVLAGCTPKIEVAAPSEPVTINLNVKIEHEIRVKVEKDLEDIFTEDSGLF